MNIEKTKIVTDSSSDVTFIDGIAFESAPLKIITAEKEYVDDKDLDVEGMVRDLANYKGKSKTSCPNPSDWISAFGDAENVFCVTITGNLSGSHNAACIAKAQYEKEHPERKVFVLDSLSTGPEMSLIIDKMRELILGGHEFDEITEKINEYSKRTGLLFMLESMKNLANNGRISPIVAKMASFIGIRLVGKASDVGTLEPLSKCRGEKNAIETIVEHMKTLGYRGGKVKIAHCLNEKAAEKLKELLKAKFENVRAEIYACRGLCSFYAELGGMLVGFEKEPV